MKEIRLANTIIRTLIKDRVHYPGRLIADTLSIIARCGVLLILYWYVFKLDGGTINGTSYQIVAWSMFFYFAFSSLRLRSISVSIMHDVRSGAIELLFSKPISYLLYRDWWQIGSGLYSFLVATVVGSIALIAIIGLPSTMTTAMFIPTLILVLLGSAILSLILYSIVGLLAFWIEDITPVFWIIDKTVMILGGSYLPVALFPPLMYQIALYSPFGASQFITHTIYASWQSGWYTFIGLQVFWIATLGLVMVLLFKRARERTFVNGG